MVQNENRETAAYQAAARGNRCDYLETGEIPETLQPMEKIAFSAFFPDMEEAWTRYEQRVKNGASGGRPTGQ